MEWCIADGLKEDAAAYGHVAGRRIRLPASSTRLRCRPITTAEWRPWRSGSGGSAKTSSGNIRRSPSTAPGPRADGAADDADRLLALADGATSKIPLSDGSATIEPWVAILRAHMMPNGAEQALADVDLALNQLSPDSIWIPTGSSAEELPTPCSAQPTVGEPQRNR